MQATVKPGVDPAVVEKEIDAVDRATLIAKGPTAEELQRAQSRKLADFVRGMERLGGFGGRSDVLAESMTFGGKPDAYLDRLERLAHGDARRDVQKAAKTWLDAPHYTLLVKPFPQLAAGQDRRRSQGPAAARRRAGRRRSPRCSAPRCRTA